MPLLTTTEAVLVAEVRSTGCTHCGLPCTDDFCCSGCATAHALLQRCGLGAADQLRHASVAAGRQPRPVPLIQLDAEEWSDPQALTRFGQSQADGTWLMLWTVDGLHCPACVWVLERLGFLDAGVRQAQIDLGRGVLRTVHDPQRTDVLRIASTAATLGYRLRPWSGAAADDQRVHRSRALAVRAAVAFAAAVGSMHLALNLSAGELTGDLDASLRLAFASGALLLALPAGTWAVWPWWRALATSLRHGRWSMDAAAALVIAVGLGASLAHLLSGSQVTYADAVAMFAALLLGGRLVLQRTHDRLAVQSSHLHGVLPLTVPAVDTQLVVSAGQRLPADGIALIAQHATIDRSVLTGESRPHLVQVGETLFAGCLVAEGLLTMRVTAAGPRTRIAMLVQAAESAAALKSTPSHDRWERWYGPLVLVAAACAWLATDAGRAIAVVMVACPCAIGLALPLARAAMLAQARQRGLLVRNASVFQRLRQISTTVIDKTGTLTTGRMQVTSWKWLVPADEQPLLAGAIVAAEQRCRHPAALAIEQHLGDVPAVTVASVEERPARGLAARIAEPFPGDLTISPDEHDGLVVRWNQQVVATLRLHDGLRPDAADLIRELRQRTPRIIIASGDSAAPVQSIVDHLGICDARHGQTPEQKAEAVDASSLMIGDGVNDAAAFARAGASIAISGGLIAGLTCADVTVVDGQRPLSAICWLLSAADHLQRRERLLLFFTIIYNALAISAALSGLWGPLLCAIGMPLSSVVAVVMATWLRLPISSDRT